MTESNHKVVTFSSLEGAVGQITFKRPPANAYDLAFHEQLNAAIEAADNHPDTRVVIIRSELENFFCAGADIKVFAENSTNDNKTMVAAAQSALAKIEASPKPFIACIAGHCLGGGLEIAMACDMRFAAIGVYKLGLPEARLGLLPGNGGSQRLPRLVGASHAFAMLASGESIDPEEACCIGLLNRFYDRNDLLAGTISFAKAIAESAPLAVAACKRAVQDGLSMPLKDALHLESSLLEELYDTEDAQEGFRAFIEKRPPDFKGR